MWACALVHLYELLAALPSNDPKAQALIQRRKVQMLFQQRHEPLHLLRLLDAASTEVTLKHLDHAQSIHIGQQHRYTQLVRPVQDDGLGYRLPVRIKQRVDVSSAAS